MKRHTLPLLLLLWAPVFLYAGDKTEGEDRIFKGTMTVSALADFLKEIEPSLRSAQHIAENKDQIIYTSDEKFQIHEIKIHTHYIEVFLKSTEYPTEREMHRFEVIEGKWKRTHRKTFDIY